MMSDTAGTKLAQGLDFQNLGKPHFFHVVLLYACINRYRLSVSLLQVTSH